MGGNMQSVSVLELLCGLGIVTLCGIVCLFWVALRDTKRVKRLHGREQQKQIVARIASNG
jgi:hypothetical protein